MNDNELKHYGRKGMKWGKRIFGKQDDPAPTYAVSTVVSTQKKKDWRDEKDWIEVDEVIDNVKTKSSKGASKIDEWKNLKTEKGKIVDSKPKSESSKQTKDDKQDKQDNQTEKTNTNKETDKLNKEIDKLDKASKLASDTSTILTTAGKLNKGISDIRTKKQVKREIDEMDNKQLRERIERLTLEAQYKNLNKDRMSKGHEYVKNTLETGATVASITATSLTIAKLIKELRKK